MIRFAGIVMRNKSVLSCGDRRCVSMRIAALLPCLFVLPAHAQDDYRARYGHADMEISCGVQARDAFTRGLLQLHSFAWQISRASFEQAVSIDPNCAIAYWGVAMSYYDGLHEHPSADEVAAARTALASAGTATTKTAREVAYIEAAAEIYRGYPDVERVDRDLNYSLAMKKIVDAYPDDQEARIFHALSLLALARRGEDEALVMQAAQLLEPLFAELPEHPGVAHYLIHAYDDAGDREPGIAAAQRYAGIAPLMTHAQHMPSHIFAGLGMWADSNASNATALEVNPRYYHSLMYLVYGHLQLGQWQEAQRLVTELEAFADSPQGGRQELRGLHLTNTWLLLETRDWAAAATAPAYSDRPLEFAETLYVRGLGSARTGALDAAAEAARSLTSLLNNLDTVTDPDLLMRAQLIRIQINQIRAFIALANDRADEAVAIMQSAIDIEDGPGINRAPPDSGTGLPAHEVFGEILLQLERYDEARQQFERALQRTPNRLHSMLGLARSAAKSGDAQAAGEHYRKLLEMLANADAGSNIVAEANDYLGQHQQ